MSTINSWGKTTPWSQSQSTAVAPNLNTVPASLDPAVFAAWRHKDQSAYIERHGAGNPKSVEIGLRGGETITASIVNALTVVLEDINNVEIAGAAVGVVANPSDFALDPRDLKPSIFKSWMKNEQYRYLEALNQGRLNDDVDIGARTAEPRIEARVVKDVVVRSGLLTSTIVAADIPYYQLNGSSNGMPSAFVRAQAESLFPTLDGVTHKLSVAERPAKFSQTPASLTTDALRKEFLSDFTKWHSAYQLEYVHLHGSSGTLNIPTSGTPLMTAVISKSDPTMLYIVNSLQKADFAKMSKLDQDNIATTAAFAAMSSRLGLASTSANTVPSVNGTGNTTPSNAAVHMQSYIISKTGSYAGSMPAGDKEYFTKQIDILREQLTGMGVISAPDFNKKLTEIKDRFDRAHAFWDVRVPQEEGENMRTPQVFVSTFTDVISRDDVANDPSIGAASTDVRTMTVRKGYTIFIAQEKRIQELAEARMQITRDNGVLFGQNLDVPNLVFRFQSLYNLQLEAQVVMETEEINQQNDLLKTYAAMQDVVNFTLSKFEKADSGKQRINGRGVDDYQYISLAEKRLWSMFEDLDGAGLKHPLETLRNVTRPKHDFFLQNTSGDHYDLNEFSHTQWSTFGTRLSEAVTILNQNSQIKMNDINSLDKQRNRHFELANGALAKMSEIVNNIART